VADTPLGCFGDGPLRALRTQLYAMGPMTPPLCGQLARTVGQPVYGLQDSSCWVGEYAGGTGAVLLSVVLSVLLWQRAGAPLPVGGAADAVAAAGATAAPVHATRTLRRH
jgi:hypothetical protein